MTHGFVCLMHTLVSWKFPSATTAFFPSYLNQVEITWRKLERSTERMLHIVPNIIYSTDSHHYFLSRKLWKICRMPNKVTNENPKIMGIRKLNLQNVLEFHCPITKQKTAVSQRKRFPTEKQVEFTVALCGSKPPNEPCVFFRFANTCKKLFNAIFLDRC